MTRYVLRDGQLVDKRFAAPLGENVAPYVILDGMDATAHPITGKLMDSKSEFRKVTRANGCTEVGNEPMTPREIEYDRRGLQADIKRAYDSLRDNPQRGPRPRTYYEGGFSGDGWQN